jgi:hypothetical protein
VSSTSTTASFCAFVRMISTCPVATAPTNQLPDLRGAVPFLAFQSRVVLTMTTTARAMTAMGSIAAVRKPRAMRIPPGDTVSQVLEENGRAQAPAVCARQSGMYLSFCSSSCPPFPLSDSFLPSYSQDSSAAASRAPYASMSPRHPLTAGHARDVRLGLSRLFCLHASTSAFASSTSGLASHTAPLVIIGVAGRMLLPAFAPEQIGTSRSDLGIPHGVLEKFSGYP